MPRDQTQHDNFTAFLGLPALWLLVFMIQVFSAGDGRVRALLLVVVTCLVIWSLHAGGDRSEFGDFRGERLFRRTCLILMLAQALFCVILCYDPHLGNMGKTTLGAARVMLFGRDPYTEPVDPLFPGPLITEGYKYLPVMPVAYIPFGALLSDRGILLTNLLLQVGVAAVIVGIVARGGKHHTEGAVAAVLYLSIPLVPYQIFGAGVTDLVPVLLSLLGIFLADEQPFFAGLAAGLSCSAKFLPGAAILPCCLPSTPRGREVFFFGLVLGLAPTLIYLAHSPSAFLANAFDFNLARNPDQASMISGVSDHVALAAQALVGALWAGLAIVAWRLPPPLEQRCGLAAILILTAILVSPTVHQSDNIWWIPLGAIAVARPAVLELTRWRAPKEFRE